MAMLANRVWIWRYKGTAGDRRLGFVEMGDALARGEIVGGRAQDPMVGLYALKHLDYTVAGARAAAPSKVEAPAPSKVEAPAPSKVEEADDDAEAPAPSDAETRAGLRRPRIKG